MVLRKVAGALGSISASILMMGLGAYGAGLLFGRWIVPSAMRAELFMSLTALMPVLAVPLGMVIVAELASAPLYAGGIRMACGAVVAALEAGAMTRVFLWSYAPSIYTPINELLVAMVRAGQNRSPLYEMWSNWWNAVQDPSRISGFGAAPTVALSLVSAVAAGLAVHGSWSKMERA